jgi:hypothetical protein
MANVTPVASAPSWVTLRLAGMAGVTGAGGAGAVGLVLKVAVTVVAAFTVTAQVVVPVHAPLQPVKTEPAAALAVNVIGVPTTTVSVQSAPHESPPGELVTVPLPVPFFVIVTVAVAPVVDEPLTPRDTESPPAENVTLPAKLPRLVGRNRTTTG